jgi:hypothetical protein
MKDFEVVVISPLSDEDIGDECRTEGFRHQSLQRRCIVHVYGVFDLFFDVLMIFFLSTLRH